MKRFQQLIVQFLFPLFAISQTVVDIVVNSNDHNTLETAVLAADLAGTLSGAGPFTLFAPTDAAFSALDPDLLNAALGDPQGLLTEVLLYHAISGDIRSGDLMDGQTAMTINGKNINVTIDPDGVLINNARVTVVDLVAENGVVHVIDAVLLPPRVTVVDVVVNSDVHTTLETAVLAADLAGTLSGDGPFTLFAPTDAAFDALDPAVLTAALDDPQGLLTQVLLYHAISGDIRSGDLMNGQTATTINGKDVTVTIDPDGVIINDARVSMADIVTDNGVVHVIDAVLLPPRVTVVDIVVNSDDHNTLETAVLAANLAGTLSGDGPFTLFAPTDAAFDALDPAILSAALDDPQGLLTDVLLYHAISGQVLRSDLMDGQTAATINGQDVSVTIDGNGGVFINDAQVTVVDLVTDNGVVHVIDAVLLPGLSSVEAATDFASFEIYPNPTTDFLRINLEQSTKVLNQMFITDFSGRTVLTNKNVNNQSTIDVSTLDSGSYLVELRNATNSFYKKLVIN